MTQEETSGIEMAVVPGYNGEYSITKSGELYSHRWKRFLRTHLRPEGHYARVSLRGKSVYVHAVVMLSWVGPCPEGQEVDHVDGNARNNHLSNLRYLPVYENRSRNNNKGRTIQKDTPADTKEIPVYTDKVDVVIEKQIEPIRKRFDIELYAQYDTPACDVVAAYLLTRGVYASRNPDKYGPDLIVYTGLRSERYVEVEVKRVWAKERSDFPWNTLQIPERKSKFVRMHKPIEFWVLREDLAKAVVVDKEVIKGSPLVVVPNKQVESGEKFYKIDVSKCRVVELDEGEETHNAEQRDTQC